MDLGLPLSAESPAWAALQLRFQPIVALVSGDLIGSEALARLSGPDGVVVGAADFVPQLERAGLGLQLSDHVSQLAFGGVARAGADQIGFAEDLRVSINLPLDCLVAPGVLGRLDEARRAHGLDAKRIMLELTESQRTADLHQLCRAVMVLREAGYDVAIDDVTPDLPDLDALLDMPFSVVKLDKSLARAGERGGPVSRFIDGIIATAHRARMTVVAEGIEDLKSFVTLRRRGVDGGQGYWIAEPLAAADLTAWLAEWNARRARLPAFA